jgi:FtsP/CotA-like multicopper oxidase with cupredoxin domain
MRQFEQGDNLAVSSKTGWLAGRILASVLVLAALHLPAIGQTAGAEACSRPAEGSVVNAPAEIRSRGGVLRVALALRKSLGTNGEIRYCYVDENGDQSPTLRLKPGELLVLKLRNETNPELSSKKAPSEKRSGCAANMPMMDMQAATNVHFHGLMVPPLCHQDDVLHTAVASGASSFEYRVRIPATQPPGLYWYHPHPHGHSEEQVLGGASGALIIEGIERFSPAAAGLPERVLIIRDQVRISTEISRANPKPPSKDLSLNFVPAPYPDYPLAVIKIKPSQRELWRVLNASADTLAELHLLTNGKWQSMGLISVDGVPLGWGSGNSDQVEWRQDIPLPPGGRAEFLFDAPAQGGESRLLTSGVDTVPVQGDDDLLPVQNGSGVIVDDDDYTPARWIARIVASADAPETASAVPQSISRSSHHAASGTVSTLVSVHPARERKMYFSEKVLDAKNPRTSTGFYITEDGHEPAAFNPMAAPNITVRQGDIEDWVIENRSQEIHTFHIHQTHFVVLERDGKAVDEKYLRDGVAVPYWDGVSKQYPSVKVRIDFRNPAIVGTFPYHCHILQHEDGGMMGTIQVLKADAGKNAKR